ncbi:MAG: sensor histidine kinase [Bacillota bacterium]|nr:sensor histidine kinase [Bacillota bacterium]
MKWIQHVCKGIRIGRSIRAKMLLFILLLSAIEFICAFLMISLIYRSSNIEKSYEDNARTLNNIEVQLSVNREKVNSFMLDIQGDPIFMQSLSMIVQEGNTKEELETWALRAQERIRNNLRLKEDLLIAEIHVAGQPQAKINVVQSVSRGFWDEYEKKYMKNVLAIPGKMLVFVPENEAHLVFSRAQPIQYKKQNLGYYCINVVFNQNRITQILKQNMPDASRQAVFFDEEGAILSRTSALFDGMSAVDLGVLEPGRGINTNATGQWTYQTRYLEVVNMYVSVMTDMSSIDLTGRSFLLSVGLIAISMIIMTFLAALLITKWINRPIRELTRQFGEILSTSPRKPLVVQGSAELESVADGINMLLEKQELLIRDNYRNKILEKNARIELLQVQINPHFVFNTLDVINWFIYENRNKEAGEVLLALGEMLRYSTYQYRSFVPLKEEIRQIKNYLHIQLIRYDYSFRVEVDMEDGLEDYMIPCLIIQPLVENAVKYGVTRKESGGHLSVSAVRGQGEMVITVFDNGPGMTREQIARALHGDASLDSSISGIGLRNVNQRMILLFGEPYAISVESEPNFYTRIMIRLPLRSESA